MQNFAFKSTYSEKIVIVTIDPVQKKSYGTMEAIHWKKYFAIQN